ncbi:uncharacterized protein PAC_15770 [Phialocephala subalpina]|uniref:Epidermal growth factor receptor-like transmembrane-juxtamembrane segment domain-containing protein n=1 Tax=Phialocephala subalpina TaxID=576137 RepID=A0A1L7XLD1_9HELO|nr:uncharacterized protein PAC_15770 [Phialocephala subalpina]
MRINVLRSQTDCPKGKQWYTCQSNGFTGCCSNVNVCDLSTCPDVPSSTSASQLQTTTLTVSATPSAIATTSSSLLDSSSTPSSTTSILINAGLANSTSSTVTATASPSETASSSTSKSNATPIIAGVVAGVVFLSIMSILIWFCIRRRKQKKTKTIRNSILEFGVPNKEFVLDRSTVQSFQDNETGVFEPFGGRYQSRSSSRTTTPKPLPAILPTSPPPHISSHNHTRTHAEHQHHLQSRPQLPRSPPRPTRTNSDPTIEQIEAADAPLPTDPEKAALCPPPEHEHPIYGLPAFLTSPTPPPFPHPGIPINPNLEPIHAGPTTLQDLPSFVARTSVEQERERYSNRTSFSLPRRTSEVTRSTTASRRHQLWRNSEYMGSSSSSKPSPSVSQLKDSPVPGRSELEGGKIQSPIKGRSELEGDQVPDHFLTPAIPQHVGGSGVHRGNTNSTNYSVPIGLGVDSTSPTSLYSQSSFAPPLPHQPPIQQQQQQNQPSNLQQQMTGPIGPNLTSPLLTSISARYSSPLDSYFKSPSLYVSTREILDGHDKEVVSPLSGTSEVGRWSGSTALDNLTPWGLGVDSLSKGDFGDIGDVLGDGMGKGGFVREPERWETEQQKQMREELTPLSAMSVDVEREWGEWALR